MTPGRVRLTRVRPDGGGPDVPRAPRLRAVRAARSAAQTTIAAAAAIISQAQTLPERAAPAWAARAPALVRDGAGTGAAVRADGEAAMAGPGAVQDSVWSTALPRPATTTKDSSPEGEPVTDSSSPSSKNPGPRRRPRAADGPCGASGRRLRGRGHVNAKP
jgi:hypothetical protein